MKAKLTIEITTNMSKFFPIQISGGISGENLENVQTRAQLRNNLHLDPDLHRKLPSKFD